MLPLVVVLLFATEPFLLRNPRTGGCQGLESEVPAFMHTLTKACREKVKL